MTARKTSSVNLSLCKGGQSAIFSNFSCKQLLVVASTQYLLPCHVSMHTYQYFPLHVRICSRAARVPGIRRKTPFVSFCLKAHTLFLGQVLYISILSPIHSAPPETHFIWSENLFLVNHACYLLCYF